MSNIQQTREGWLTV